MREDLIAQRDARESIRQDLRGAEDAANMLAAQARRVLSKPRNPATMFWHSWRREKACFRRFT